MHNSALSNLLVQAHIEELRRSSRHSSPPRTATPSGITRGIEARLSTYIGRTTQRIEIVGNTSTTTSAQSR